METMSPPIALIPPPIRRCTLTHIHTRAPTQLLSSEPIRNLSFLSFTPTALRHNADLPLCCTPHISGRWTGPANTDKKERERKKGLEEEEDEVVTVVFSLIHCYKIKRSKVIVDWNGEWSGSGRSLIYEKAKELKKTVELSLGRRRTSRAQLLQIGPRHWGSACICFSYNTQTPHSSPR